MDPVPLRSGDDLRVRDGGLDPVWCIPAKQRFVVEEFDDGIVMFDTLVDAGDFADVDIRMIRVWGARRWARPQVQFIVDGTTPFDPFPIDHALPMFEWGNESIAVMRAFGPDATFGPTFPKTRKGAVAHLRVPEESVARGNEPATIGAIVFPDFQSGASNWIRPLPKATALLKLAGNSFNYEVVGEAGFRTLSIIVGRCESYILRYGDLADAHAALNEIMSKAPGR